MTSAQKGLNILSIISLVLGVIGIVVGAVFLFGGGAVLGFGGGTDASNAVGVLGIAGGAIILLEGIIETVAGVMGRNAAKDAQKCKPFIILVIVFLVFDIIALAYCGMDQIGNNLFSSLWNLALLYYARKVQKEAGL